MVCAKMTHYWNAISLEFLNTLSSFGVGQYLDFWDSVKVYDGSSFNTHNVKLVPEKDYGYFNSIALAGGAFVKVNGKGENTGISLENTGISRKIPVFLKKIPVFHKKYRYFALGCQLFLGIRTVHGCKWSSGVLQHGTYLWMGKWHERVPRTRATLSYHSLKHHGTFCDQI